MENNKLLGVVFLDLKKAFDTVYHNISINKLLKMNVHIESIGWFENYLAGCMQAVKAIGVKSNKRLINCGVPQGSILGPRLFIIYINDLSEHLFDCNINLYADDMAL